MLEACRNSRNTRSNNRCFFFFLWPSTGPSTHCKCRWSLCTPPEPRSTSDPTLIIFSTIRQYHLSANPARCTEVASRSLSPQIALHHKQEQMVIMRQAWKSQAAILYALLITLLNTVSFFLFSFFFPNRRQLT